MERSAWQQEGHAPVQLSRRIGAWLATVPEEPEKRRAGKRALQEMSGNITTLRDSKRAKNDEDLGEDCSVAFVLAGVYNVEDGVANLDCSVEVGE